MQRCQLGAAGGSWMWEPQHAQQMRCSVPCSRQQAADYKACKGCPTYPVPVRIPWRSSQAVLRFRRSLQGIAHCHLLLSAAGRSCGPPFLLLLVLRCPIGTCSCRHCTRCCWSRWRRDAAPSWRTSRCIRPGCAVVCSAGGITLQMGSRRCGIAGRRNSIAGWGSIASWRPRIASCLRGVASCRGGIAVGMPVGAVIRVQRGHVRCSSAVLQGRGSRAHSLVVASVHCARVSCG